VAALTTTGAHEGRPYEKGRRMAPPFVLT
jgi:hypothetical protein